MIYWCKSCNIPLIDKTECTICKRKLKAISNDIRPVFIIEKIFVSSILGEDVTKKSVWNKHSIYYIIDGKNVTIPD